MFSVAGTALSKCYKIINRFSEDIDLTLDDEHFTQGKRRALKYGLVKVCNDLNLKIVNLEGTRSRRDYNRYDIDYPKAFENKTLKQQIYAEAVFIQKSFPTTIKQATTILYDYLTVDERKILLEKYEELTPFNIKVQSLERTFIDKVFAICDYIISGNIQAHSRHIYDLYCLMPNVDINQIKMLINQVREERKRNERSYSTKDGVNINSILKDIVDKELYKDDYENTTKIVLYKYIPYEESIKVVSKIIDSKLFE